MILAKLEKISLWAYLPCNSRRKSKMKTLVQKLLGLGVLAVGSLSATEYQLVQSDWYSHVEDQVFFNLPDNPSNPFEIAASSYLPGSVGGYGGVIFEQLGNNLLGYWAADDGSNGLNPLSQNGFAWVGYDGIQFNFNTFVEYGDGFIRADSDCDKLVQIRADAPEPASWGAMALGLSLLGVGVWRKRKLAN